MSVNTVTNVSNPTDAQFRAWALAIHNVLSAGGWVQTTDTGQINLSTVTAPGGTDAVAGYEVWRSNDTGGSLTEFYIKIEYGSGSTSAQRPSIWITAGWGSNGSGTLTGQLSTRFRAVPGGIPASATAMNIAAGSGYVCIALYENTSSVNFFISIERNRDTSLNLKNEVHLIVRAASATDSQVITQTVTFGDAGGVTQAIMPQIANTPIGGVAGLGLIFGMAPGPTSPSMNVLGAEQGSLGLVSNTITVTVFGASHTYKIQENAGGFTSHNWLSGTTSSCVLTRYE